MSTGRPEPRRSGAGWGHGPVLAASLAIAITAGVGALLFRPWWKEPAPPAARASPAVLRGEAAVAPLAGERSTPLDAAGDMTIAALSADAAPGASASEAAHDSLATLQRAVPALERAAWDEIAAALSPDMPSKGLPRALRALALDLAGKVRTTAGAGPGELTHPIVLSRILDEVLAKGGERLSAAQREQAASLVTRSASELDRLLAAAPARPRLASIVAEVELKLDFVDGLGEVLTARQRAVLDRLVLGGNREGALLSPLALIEAREVDVGADGEAFRRSAAAELIRELEIDPALAGTLAAALHRDLAMLFDGSTSELSLPERALIAARAQARSLEELLRSPTLSAEARERVLRMRAVAVPRAR